MQEKIKIGIIGDFDPQKISHLATNEAIEHAAAALGQEVLIDWLPTPGLERDTADTLAPYNALWCSPGSPYHSFEGALAAIRYAREHSTPFIGT